MIRRGLNKLNGKSAAMILFLIVFIASVNFIACMDQSRLGLNNFSYSDEPLLSTGPLSIETNYYTNITWASNITTNTFYIDKWITNYVTNVIEVVTTNVVTMPVPDKAIDYYRVYVPYAQVHDGNYNYNYTNVSYKDTNGLHNLWKYMMTRQPFFIRNSRNTLHQSEFKNGNDYYYFDSGLNIRHKKYDNYILKQYFGAVIVKFEHGSQKGTWSVGGVYRNGLYPHGNNGYNTIFSGDSSVHSAVREFMHSGHNRDPEMVELIIMNTGRRSNGDTEFGVDTYYNTHEYDDWGLGNGIQYRNDHRAYVGNRPEYYWGYLNEKVILKHYNDYTFVAGKAEN